MKIYVVVKQEDLRTAIALVRGDLTVRRYRGYSEVSGWAKNGILDRLRRFASDPTVSFLDT